MAYEFPVGNQFWKLRASSGKQKTFESPENLWQSAIEYFTATDARKWTKKDWVGKDAMEVTREVETPYTWSGLALFLDVSEQTLRNYGQMETHRDYFDVITRIGQIIYTQKLEGAVVGTFNANIIARDLGLAEKNINDNTHSVTNEVLQALADKLNS